MIKNHIKPIGKGMKTIGYIYAVIMKVFDKSLAVDEALEMIRKILM